MVTEELTKENQQSRAISSALYDLCCIDSIIKISLAAIQARYNDNVDLDVGDFKLVFESLQNKANEMYCYLDKIPE